MTNQDPTRPTFTAPGPSGAPFASPSQPTFTQQPRPAGVSGDSGGFGGPQQPMPPHPMQPQATATAPQPRQPKVRRRLAGIVAVAMLSAGVGGGAALTANHYLASGSPSGTPSATTTQVVQASANNPDWTATAAAVKDAVVAIQVTGRNGSGSGSGVIIDDKGHIITNNHVVAGGGGGGLNVTISNRTYTAEIVGTDPSTDLAVIKIKNPPSDLKVASWGDSTKLNVGQPVMAIGNPLGLSDTVTTGIISALNRPVTTQAVSDSVGDQGNGVVVTSAIQTNAAINPGNSGGALVDSSGNLIGITSSIATLTSSTSSGQSGNIGIGFAIPAAQAKDVAEQLIAKGSVEHAQLGINAADGNQDSQLGAKVENVAPGSAAANAGLQNGDLITSLDGQPVKGSESLVALIRNSKVGQEVTLGVMRGGSTLELKATLGAAVN